MSNSSKRNGLAVLLAFAAAMLTAMLLVAGCSGANSSTSNGSENPSSGTASGTSTPAAEPVQLQIFAANSLEKAMPQVQALYTSKHPEVTFADTQFKASGDLVEQMKAGGSCDVFISASSGSMDTAASNGNVDSSTRVDMFKNDLIIVKAKNSELKVDSLDIVKDPAITRIAIGDGATVPAGQYANQSLNSIKLYSEASGKDGTYDDAIVKKMIIADKVGTAANYVATGDCQIGFVYTSDLYRYDGIESAYTVPADSHKPIIYPGAVGAASQHAVAAKDFLSFCLSDPDALKIWAEYGFEVQ
ncbi:MAG: molybdate ABC transporter substrate-binding protein [Actinomycetia bacterium]|nr:molybdate ABC transporter substrate-binding protein [Actinomycetes bacterium]